MKYRVNIGWNYYLFDSSDDAMRFAITAKRNSEKSEICVTIELLDEVDLLGEEDSKND